MPTSEHAQRLVSTLEAARILNVTVASVNRFARDGLLTVALKGEGVRGANWYLRADVENLAARRESVAS